MMVNYCYDLTLLEQRHEKFVNEGVVARERLFEKQLSGSVMARREPVS